MGFAMTGAMWGPLLPHLSDRHACATYDHRGTGRSEGGPPPDRMEALAADAGRVLDQLGWDRAHVVGISMGGMIAQELALRWPERVRTLSLLVTHPGGLAVVPPLAGLAVLAAPRDRGWKLERLLYPPGTVPAARTKAQLAQRIPRAAFLGQLRAILGHDTRDRLASLTTPTLVVKADRDILVRPTGGDALARAIPNARTAVVEGAGHGLVASHPAEVAGLLASHFASG